MMQTLSPQLETKNQSVIALTNYLYGPKPHALFHLCMWFTYNQRWSHFADSNRFIQFSLKVCSYCMQFVHTFSTYGKAA